MPTREPAPDSAVEWMRQHAIALRSIDPGDADFADLRPLATVLGKARVVVLGEASHGDGNTFLAKARLVRFLHQELGFDVLAFESGLYDCWKAWQLVQAGEDPEAAFRRSVFPIWTESQQVQPLIASFAAAARSPRPLELAGIDPQFTNELSRKHLVPDLTRVAAAVGMQPESFAARVAAPLANLVESRYEVGEVPDAPARDALRSALNELEQHLRRDGAHVAERELWLRVVANTRDLAALAWGTDWKRPLLEQPAEYAVRERLMGETLTWLARDRYRQRKLIVWLHSGHAFRNVAGIDVPSPVHARLYRTLEATGDVAHRALGDELYVVGTLAYQGVYGQVWDRTPDELLRPTGGSLEDLFHRTGLAHAFLDLRQPRLPRWLREPLIARPIGYKEMKARWGEVFDGMLFLERQDNSRRAAGAPS